jgi:DNA-binding transcriptional MerR regulator
MANYSIKDLEKLSGIKAHTIRIWERRYNLVNPHRTNTNIRYYEDCDLKKLLNISILVRNGLKISKIAQLSTGELSEKVLLSFQQSSDTNSAVENMIMAMVELDEVKFDRIFSNYVISMGFETAFIKILYPFFERIGLLWQAGTIIPAQEHFITNLVRQKLIVAIDSQTYQNNIGKNGFLLFLPEGEFHEVGLLFFNYALRKRGYKTIYLGQTVPLDDVKHICKTSSAEFLLTSVITSIAVNKINKFILELSQLFPDKTIFLCGTQIASIDFNLPSNIIQIKSPSDFLKRIDMMN